MGEQRKHAELIKAWADGAEIQKYVKVLESGNAFGGVVKYDWVSQPKPEWKEDGEYRIKPKEKQKVKMWQWVYDDGAEYQLTTTFHPKKPDDDYIENFYGEYTRFIKPADWTEIEVEVEDE